MILLVKNKSGDLSEINNYRVIGISPALSKLFEVTLELYITRSSATAKSTARPSCLVGVLYDISREKIC